MTKSTETNGVATKKKGLRPLQIRVLQELCKAKGPLDRARLYERLKFKNNSGLNDVLGRNDPEVRAKIDAEKYPCLLTLGHVRLKEIDVEGVKERVYEITANGKKALVKAEK